MDRATTRWVAWTLVYCGISMAAAVGANAADKPQAAPPAIVSPGSLALLVQQPIGPVEVATHRAGLTTPFSRRRSAWARPSTTTWSAAWDCAVPSALSLAPRLAALGITRGEWWSFFAWATREGRSGCVESLEVLDGPDPELNVAAIGAASQWRYSPAMVNGAPVAVVATVTVSFKPN